MRLECEVEKYVMDYWREIGTLEERREELDKLKCI